MAQAAHAVTRSMILLNDDKHRGKWLQSPHQTVIVLEARDENHMKNIKDYLDERGFPTAEVIDEGVNEIDPHTWTALAAPILNKDNEKVYKAFSSFNLYRDTIRVRLDIDR
jgi:peptidyl-tRNA hydrolase